MNLIQENQTTHNTNKPIEKESESLHITFLGGIKEIGRNCTAYEYKNKIYIIDCGTIFRSSWNLGVNIALPNIDYLLANSHKIQSILITHGHEDHIGGIKYLIGLIKRPISIYIGKFPGEILKSRFAESKDTILKENCSLIHKIKNNFTFYADKDIKFKFVNVTHSTPDTYFIFIKTNNDTVLHTGDWKFDLTPIGQRTDFFNVINTSSRNGVDLVVTDSTRCDQDGFSDSESSVIEKFDTILDKYTDKRIFVSIFGSNADRIIKLVELAKSYKRKVFLSGWSIIKCIKSAIKINLIQGKDMFLNIESINKFDHKDVFVLCTGAQGEPEASLTKMVEGKKKNVHMDYKDLVIFSSNIIPGNEKNTMKLIENMLEKKIQVLHPTLSQENAKFHVSGHGMEKDILMLLNLVKPKNFIPVHGELHHLLSNIDIAKKYGVQESNIFLPSNGKQYSLFKGKLTYKNLLPFKERLVDSYEEYIDHETVDERSNLGKQGMIILIIEQNNSSLIMKDIIFVSVSNIFNKIKKDIISSINDHLKELNPNFSHSMLKNMIKNDIKKMISSFVSFKDNCTPSIIIKVLE